MSYRVFDKYADEYDQWYRDNTIIWINELECVRSLEPHGITLDIGVGTGAFVNAVKGFIIGLDPALNMLVKAHKRGVEVVNGFGEFLPFRSDSFDTIMMIVALEFVDDPDKVLKEARRVLKPMGKLIICFIQRDSEWGEYYMSSSGSHKFMSIARLYTLDEVLVAALRHGFAPQDLSLIHI